MPCNNCNSTGYIWGATCSSCGGTGNSGAGGNGSWVILYFIAAAIWNAIKNYDIFLSPYREVLAFYYHTITLFGFFPQVFEFKFIRVVVLFAAITGVLFLIDFLLKRYTDNGAKYLKITILTYFLPALFFIAWYLVHYLIYGYP